ncbi:unnamed protein product [Arabidopsis thaliana]|uniref:(thale cress) hypothetical protein n=1 Tax=Arabidopsis thaliana TaxID=3702 RepID=A0A7G2FJL4_ARATH|nr:unnamed protein product [Arabidopsis thaliana]
MSSSFLSSTAFFLLLCLGFCHVSSSSSDQGTYIVHMAKSQMPSSFDLHSNWYDSSLRSISDSAELLYTYENAIHGFSTRLTQEEADSLMTQPGVISVLPEHRYELHTTRTPLFLGLDEHTADLFPEAGSYSDVVVGNFTGVSLFKGEALPDKLLPFIYAGNASNATNGNLCMTGTLIPEKVKGKIVMCDRGINARVQKGDVVKAAGGVGMILANTAANGEELVADAHLLPATTVGEKAGDIIRHYVTTDPNPTASISILGTVVGVKPSPVVAAFSSRGPNSITPNILKPDLIAPGVNILAAWTGAAGPTGLASDSRRVEFNIISGTSMSCPHVSGLAALLKSVHPEWSPAAIRSALMTTAYKTYKDGKPLLDIATGKPSTPFDHGAGHVSPTTATNPGLIYDLTTEDYLGFLCALNYTSPQIRSVSRRNYTCDPSKSYSVADLNYPSFAVNVDGAGAYKYTRTVTSVGGAGTYSVKVTSETTGVKISVEPAVLNFKEANEKKSYTVTFTVDSSKPSGSNSFGSIEWSDGKHVVGSPVAISWT